MKEWKRSGKFNRHHITPKSRGGKNKKSNILRMDKNRHQAWHLLFNNLKLEEVIELLKRLERLKNRAGD
jgi:hypothetical protein